MPRSRYANVPSEKKMKLPLVSVVIPTYNHAPLLRNAINSVLNQTFTDWEAIVINNYSEDNTIEIVSSFNDPRIRLVNFHNHGIIAASRNRGIELSNGKFVAFLDSDDIWYSEKLERCLSFFDSGNDAVCHGEVWVEDRTVLRKVYYGPQRRTHYNSLLYDGNCLSTSAIIVKKSSLSRVGGFDENPSMVTAEDYELWLKLAKSGCTFALLDEVLGEYRIHGKNQSKAVARNLMAELAVINKHFSEIPHRKFLARWKLKRRFALAYYGGARSMQANGNYEGSLKLLFKSCTTFPFILRQYAAAGIGVAGYLKRIRQ